MIYFKTTISVCCAFLFWVFVPSASAGITPRNPSLAVLEEVDCARLLVDAEYVNHVFSPLIERRKFYPIQIVSMDQVAPEVRAFRFKVAYPQDKRMEFKPGQWTNVLVPELLLEIEPEGRVQAGGYSFTSSPLEPTFDLMIRGSQNSKNPVTRYIHTKAQTGTLLLAQMGQGKIHHSENLNPSIVLIGAGIGITPLISILKHALVTEPETQINLIYGAKTPELLLFKDTVTELEAKFPNLKSYFTVSQPDQSKDFGTNPWSGPIGRIDSGVLNALKLEKNAHYFVIGPNEMIQQTVENLKAMGVDAAHISSEWWN